MSLPKTIARSSSRKPENVQPNLTLKLPADHLAALKGMASLGNTTVAEAVRRLIAKELAASNRVAQP